jgi:LmbE family N-acetylglucosaminyl deacetylase
MEPGLPTGRVVVLSPHLDDAVFSLGAAIAAASRRGGEIRIVTVLAGDPDSKAEAGRWDRRCGFSTHVASVVARREEDRRACAIVGAAPVWLPYNDDQYVRGADDETIWEALAGTIQTADAVLCPGFPLAHPDHGWLARMVLARIGAAPPLGLYVEQPYTWQSVGAPDVVPQPIADLMEGLPRWVRMAGAPRDLLAKTRSALAYRSQLRRIPRRHLLRVVAHEVKRGGEAVAWLTRP